MTDLIHSIEQFAKHLPAVTCIAMSMAALFILLRLTNRWRECSLLAAVCVAYGLTPYVPHW